MVLAQEYLDQHYPKAERGSITELGIERKILEGHLDLSDFVNLKKLYLGTVKPKKIQQRIFNRFNGSLEPLRNLVELRNLSISNTDIDSGLEYLPESVEKLNCLANKRTGAKVKVFCKLLANEQEKIETENGYVKDFPQKLGLLIVAVAAIGFLVLSADPHRVYLGVWLLVAAVVIDALLYFFVPKITVYYRCRAEFRNLPLNPAHEGFELSTAEKYRTP